MNQQPTPGNKNAGRWEQRANRLTEEEVEARVWEMAAPGDYKETKGCVKYLAPGGTKWKRWALEGGVKKLEQGGAMTDMEERG